MSSSTSTKELCRQYRRTAATVGHPLGVCSNCQTALYCSECLWYQHKPECRTPREQQRLKRARSDSPPPESTVTATNATRNGRMRLAAMPDTTNTSIVVPQNKATSQNRTSSGSATALGNSRLLLDEEKDTIHYIRISTPHLHTISISGPYKHLNEIDRHVSYFFGQKCSDGIYRLKSGTTTISRPIHNNSTHARKIEVISRVKPHLAWQLPCPVWNVFYWEPQLDALSVASPGQGVRKSMCVLGSFECKDEAEIAAGWKLDELLEQQGGQHHVSVKLEAEGFVGAVCEMPNVAAKWIVEVRNSKPNVDEMSG